MLINVGYRIEFLFEKPTHLLVMGSLNASVLSRVETPEFLQVNPNTPISQYVDSYGNLCSRMEVSDGLVSISNRAVVRDPGTQDPVNLNARQHDVRELPNDVLVFLLASRYCEVDSELKQIAWQLFGSLPAGWSLVQAVCDYTHQRIRFDYQKASATRTALGAYQDQVGVCRDYMHLAIALCRCLNVPARYCTGYLSDIGVTTAVGPMDFSAWFEVYLGNQWHTFDARNNTPRIGRILMARGRDAADVALTTTFGKNTLHSFQVWTDLVNGS